MTNQAVTAVAAEASREGAGITQLREAGFPGSALAQVHGPQGWGYVAADADGHCVHAHGERACLRLLAERVAS